ncbi:MMPL family transporter [Nakamurella aerolata]|uniref:MMPL family transporter n=1 Tax=Nakamurella aerolata TaxID=1656892 RepID=A0A849ABJ1_9ACTN|nr:MMPL family transporter [Nakamurella aerolata]NNG36508.1 MMPL family transporter [Nakamurella aerolata]
MAKALQRLGLFAAKRRVAVIVAWLLILIGVGTAAATLAGPTANSFAIPGTQSSDALETVNEKFPQLAADGATVQVVMTAPAGEAVTDPRAAAAITTAVNELRQIPDIATVTNPLDRQQPVVSQDRTVAVSTVTFNESQGNVEQSSLDRVQQTADSARSAGLDVTIGGNAFQTVPEILGPGEIVGVVIAFVVLMLTYGALAAAGANLLTALIGVGIGAAGITALTGVVDLQSTTPILAVMLGLAVGIDYALFIFARFRSELLDGRSVTESVGRATGTAGSAVVVAGLTVVIALAGLSIVGIPFLAEMGLAAAGTVVIAVLVALTLVPALLSFIGLKVLRKKDRARLAAATARHGKHQAPEAVGGTSTDDADAEMPGRSDASSHHGKHEADPDERGATPARGPGMSDGRGFLRGWANLVTGRRALSVVLGIVTLGVIALPVFGMQTALPDSGTAEPGSGQRQAYDTITEKFGPGLNGPLLLLVEGNNPTANGAAVAQRVQQTPGVVAVTPPQPAADGSATLITVIPATGPHDQATTDLVNTLRDTDFGNGSQVSVTGTTAVGIDVNTTLSDALPKYLTLVVGLALLLLLVVFRSLLVPLTATLGFLLSYGAALGVTTAVFQWGWLADVFGVAQPAPLMSLLPIIVVGILFGLAMDYQVFLVSRIHEAYAHGADPREAVRAGFRRSAPVVVAAATIMAAVFGGFIASNDPMIGSIALALTVGVLADAFIVRMLIIPGLLALLGRSAWWMPRWLDRVLPHVDVEGKAIEDADKAAASPGSAVGVEATTPTGAAKPDTGSATS